YYDRRTSSAASPLPNTQWQTPVPWPHAPLKAAPRPHHPMARKLQALAAWEKPPYKNSSWATPLTFQNPAFAPANGASPQTPAPSEGCSPPVFASVQPSLSQKPAETPAGSPVPHSPIAANRRALMPTPQTGHSRRFSTHLQRSPIHPGLSPATSGSLRLSNLRRGLI